MNRNRAIALSAATLVAGLVIGQISGAFAARSLETAEQTAGAGRGGYCGLHIRPGTMMADAGARLRDTVARLTGLSSEEIAEQRSAGKSIADIAAAEGVSTEELTDATLDARKTALDELVADGAITQAQADNMLTHMSDRITERITSTDTGCQNRSAQRKTTSKTAPTTSASPAERTAAKPAQGTAVRPVEQPVVAQPASKAPATPTQGECPGGKTTRTEHGERQRSDDCGTCVCPNGR